MVSDNDINDNDMADMTGTTRPVHMKILAPVSIALHASGEMDVIYSVVQTQAGAAPRESVIRFSALAASQLLDAIHAAAENEHIAFGEAPVYQLH